jgi:hypothetical protein
MNLDGGLGGIVTGYKNLNAVSDTLLLGWITACKHANGRDWWIMTHKYNSDLFHVVLLTPNGVELNLTQHIGEIISPLFVYNGFKNDRDNLGQSCFSPDGAHYAFVDFEWNVHVFDFDRCSGQLSNFRIDSIGCLDGSLCTTLGCIFSPNSRFLYVNTYQRIFQYDLEANDFAASRIEVAKNDSFAYPITAWFFINQLGADNRIYIGTFNGVKAIHYIEKPDSIGVACNVIQHGLTLPTYNLSLPNFPNYDLGPLQGSPCDTLNIADGVEQNKSDFDFRVYPNPVTWWLNIVYDSPQQDALFELFDLYGRRVAAVSLYHYFKNRTLDVSGLSAGVYAYTIKSKSGVLQTGKVAVVK